MRHAALVGLVIIAFACQASAAEPTVYRAVVVDSEVKLRAGPSDSFPDTGTLPRGTTVVVEREESNGWLAITAPHGSVSWIAHAFVEDLAPGMPTPKHGLVEVDGEVTLATGKAGVPQPLDVRREKVPQGTRVLLIGPPAEFNGKKWWPIAPPPGDVRYLPKTAVQFEKVMNDNVNVRVSEHTNPASPTPPPGGTVASIPGGHSPAPGTTAGKPAANHPLWIQAETAEREGRFKDAEKAYFDLAALMNGKDGDHDVANLCYTRIHSLRERSRKAAPAPTAPKVLQPPEKDDRGIRPGQPQALPTVDTPAAGAADPRPQWSGAGTLRRSAITPDGSGKPAYALETAPGVVKMYILAAQGVELEKYVGKRVDAFGTQQNRQGLSKPFMIATSVELAP